MTSEVEICNLALSHLRAGSINSLTESSIQAQQCSLKYGPLRDVVLKSVTWNFAHKIDELAVLTDEVFNWAFVYQYPSDCLKVNKLVRNYATVEPGSSFIATRQYDPLRLTPDFDYPVVYQVRRSGSKKVIVSNEKELRADYRSKVTDPNEFDPTFVYALSHLLASQLAVPLVGTKGGRELKKDHYQEYLMMITEAAVEDVNEGFEDQPDSEFIEVRG